MGLAFQSISSYSASPLFQTLISEGAVTTPVFGLMLATSGSELFFGGTNNALYTGDFSWVPLTNEVCDGSNSDLFRALICLSINRVSGKRHSIAFL